MNYRIVLVLIATLIIGGAASSQWTDYGGWASASISQKVSKKTVVSASVAMRFDRDFTRLGSTFIDADLSREVLNDLDLVISFRAGASMDDQYLWEPQRRFSANARYKYSLGKKSALSLRAQYQTGHKGASTPGEGIEFSNAARTKLTYTYKVSKTYRLSFSTEAFYRPLSSFYEFSDLRGRISVRKRVAKRKYLTIGYQVETPRGGPDPWAEHAIICNLSLDKKLRKPEK